MTDIKPSFLSYRALFPSSTSSRVTIFHIKQRTFVAFTVYIPLSAARPSEGHSINREQGVVDAPGSINAPNDSHPIVIPSSAYDECPQNTLGNALPYVIPDGLSSCDSWSRAVDIPYPNFSHFNGLISQRGKVRK
ncbi:hypothetical protein CISG_09846 [Coccidioides immitis RMSCC 3703]|uniref:Uncharacterized protein n=1 Tax=Coccidioides immitis RMSCC 3703 TaxID=454286 RepID=A0A0J8QKB3_COCIT|nr:hypothetical protein CISG_09846 [Coccidioides immitis RMSCC 3703]